MCEVWKCMPEIKFFLLIYKLTVANLVQLFVFLKTIIHNENAPLEITEEFIVVKK